MIRLIDILLLGRFMRWYDRLGEPWRFFGMFPMVLPPVYILNGAIKAPRGVQLFAAFYLMYVVCVVTWKNRE